MKEYIDTQWVALVRGILAAFLGVAVFSLPRAAFPAIALVFALYTAAEGMVRLATIRAYSYNKQQRLGAIMEGGVSLVAALVAYYLFITGIGYSVALWTTIGGWTLTVSVCAMIASSAALESDLRLRLLFLRGTVGTILGITMLTLLAYGTSLRDAAEVWLVTTFALVSAGLFIAAAYRSKQDHAEQVSGPTKRPVRDRYDDVA